MRPARSFFPAFFASILITTCRCDTVKQDLTLTWEQHAPNGQSRYAVKTNGQFPGPSLIFNEDDDVEVSSGHSLEKRILKEYR